MVTLFRLCIIYEWIPFCKNRHSCWTCVAGCKRRRSGTARPQSWPPRWRRRRRRCRWAPSSSQKQHWFNRSGVSSILLKSLRSATTFPSDIQFDAFGKRFATASSDQKIRVSSQFAPRYNFWNAIKWAQSVKPQARSSLSTVDTKIQGNMFPLIVIHRVW